MEVGVIVGDPGWFQQPTNVFNLRDSIAPDGTLTATRITNLNTQSDPDSYSNDQHSIGSNKTITYSIYVKSPDTANVGKEIHFRGKRIGGTSSSWGDYFILTAEWKRITITHTYQSDNSQGRMYIGSNPNTSHAAGAATACLFWGAQAEAGAFATSFIPTYGSTETRGSDLTIIGGEEFSEFYNPVESTILINHTHLDGITSSNLGTERRVYRFRVNTGPDTRIDYVSNSNYNPYIAKDGSTVASISHGQSTVFGGGVNRNAVRVKENSFAVSFNGSTVVEDTSGAWNPTNAIDHVTLGCYATGNLNDTVDDGSVLCGHIQRFIYYPKGLPNSQLVTLTS